ncbi:MAG: tRNA (adenosine(37)-N6)-threonylcarbamoyltransferase complex ATPase subunit type 1 TsaE [Chloroflexi bacterium]|nr:tRNA (adenosine(37)-N6)-threonylcarbamoyltransferase complex ATPase subunit type 1 TsaE [Chloroflexota bacterium]
MPVLDPYSFECLSHSEEQTQRLGARLGVLLPAHAIVALIGTLGAGKTQFARGIGAGWGAQQPLRSPSFTLVQEHRRDRDQRVLYHIDLFRIENRDGLQSFGLQEILEDENSVSIIEWADRAPDLLADEALLVKFELTSESKRHMTYSTRSASTWQILLAFRKSAFGV